MIDVRDKRVLVVGLARSGQAAARAFRKRGATVTVTDSRPPGAFQAEIVQLLSDKIGLELGEHREATFLQQDLIVVSPGVPWELAHLKAARERKILVVPEVEAAGWFLKGYRVGITGTNGKTTTATLLGRMLEASGFDTFVGGNIGVPLISAVDRVTADSVVVAELSSFQLEAIQNFRANVAVLLNLTPNHLDRHASFEAYFRAKAEIFRNQIADDYAILNADDPNVMSLVPAIAARKVFFSRRQNLPEGVLVSNGRILYRLRNLERALMQTSDVKLRGTFNLENVLAATAAACVCGADFAALQAAVRDFTGVEHRLEYLRKICDVEFYNDSKATSVDATAKALSAFEHGVHLILGGKDKGAPYAPLRPLLEDRVRTVLLIGAAAERIAQELSGATELLHAGSLETAVRQAFELARPGDVVLLAPACASYDQFQDFEHRGRVFKEIVEHLASEVAVKDMKKELPPPKVVTLTESVEPLPDSSPMDRGSGAAVLPPNRSAAAEEPGPETAHEPLGSEARVQHPRFRPEPDPEASRRPQGAPAESSASSLQSPFPKTAPHALRRPQSIFMYEVAAEEVAPLGLDAAREPPFLEGLRSPETVEDEPLLFEIVLPLDNSTSRAKQVEYLGADDLQSQAVSFERAGHKVRKSKAKKDKRDPRSEDTDEQGQLPGIYEQS